MREALYASDGFKTFSKLLILDQSANEVHEWVGRSSKFND